MELPPTVDLTQRDTVRLISTARLREPVLRPLAADDAALASLAALERITDGAMRAEIAGTPGVDVRELVFGRPGDSIVNTAFTLTRPGGNRFNGDERGAWYCAFAAATSIAELSFHLTRELEAIGRFDTVTEYAELIADFLGRFHDLRAAVPGETPALDPDPAIAYAAGQTLARRLRLEAASNGIVYPSARHPGGVCLAAFRPELVRGLREGGIWRLEWRGAPTPAVTRVA